MTVFDSSALVPLFLSSHANKAKAQAKLREAEVVWLHATVLAETAQVLRRAGRLAGLDGSKLARQAVLDLLDQPRCRIIERLDHAAAVQRYTEDARLSLVDSFVVQAAIELGTEPQAFDQSLLKAWREAKRVKLA